MENRDIIQAGIVGGIVAAITHAVPFLNFINCFCCMGIMAGGAAAVIYYDRSQPEQDVISPATAVTLGLSSGIIGAFLALALEWIMYLNFGDWQLDLLKQTVEEMEEVPAFFENLLIEVEQAAAFGFQGWSILFRNLVQLPIFCVTGALLIRIFLNRKRGSV